MFFVIFIILMIDIQVYIVVMFCLDRRESINTDAQLETNPTSLPDQVIHSQALMLSFIHLSHQ